MDKMDLRIQRAKILALMHKNGYTLDEIGKIFNITRARVHQIINTPIDTKKILYDTEDMKRWIEEKDKKDRFKQGRFSQK